MQRNVRYSLTDLTAALDAALAAKIVYNVDYKDYLKYYLNQHFENATSKIAEDFTYSMKWQNLPEAIQHLDLGYSSDLHLIAGRVEKVRKIAEKSGNLDHPYVQRIFSDMAPFVEIAAKLNELKQYIVKGKKPSDKPRKTPPRTLDNTGTCAVCGQNVKLDGQGNIVMHGYRVVWNQFSGSCPGVGYKPFEVSPEGAVAYRDAMKARIADLEKSISELPTSNMLYKTDKVTQKLIEVLAGTNEFDHLVAVRTDKMKWEIGGLNSSIKVYDRHIAGWVERPLPGTK